MNDVITVRTTDQVRRLETGTEVVVIGDFLAYSSGPEFNPELAKKSDQYKVVKNCQLKLADGEAVSVSLEDKALPRPANDVLRYPENTDTPLSGKPVERDDKIAVHATAQVIVDPHSGRKLTRLIARSSQLQPALLS